MLWDDENLYLLNVFSVNHKKKVEIDNKALALIAVAKLAQSNPAIFYAAEAVSVPRIILSKPGDFFSTEAMPVLCNHTCARCTIHKTFNFSLFFFIFSLKL